MLQFYRPINKICGSKGCNSLQTAKQIHLKSEHLRWYPTKTELQENLE